ncbi:MAG: Macrolide export ATP-binding/permease protein MacB [Firmicutes bacterium ADurb.Bin248]|nr:MAG: Macrolide export ATP-binding/permease protein MacB [Firmicutes bacterium ADurb.Bin248]HOG01287.1 ABC transporter permease [Clostridia bacterium]HPK16611.1 ABC transporter permease [Clostridia bacterium]
MVFQSLKMALNAIAASKMRSFLTMLGIIIGVTALVVMVSLVSGATGAVTSEISSLGNDMITVSIRADKGSPLRLEDLDAIKALDAVDQAAPSGSMNATAKYGYSDAMVSVYGTTAAYYDIQGLELAQGRFIKTTDVNNGSYIAVLSDEAATELFNRTDIIGETFTIAGRAFRVVGVLAKDDSLMSGMMSSLSVYVPFTVESRMAGQPYITSISISSANAQDMDATEDAINRFFMKRFEQDEDAFSLMNMSSITDALGTVTDTLTLLLGGIAAISLLVGGVGIMNIMLVSVTERTKEIGIRKAIGAGRGSIMMQFLIEALLLSLFGCVFGLLFSWGILEIVTLIAGGISFAMSPSTIALAVGFSSAIGLIFGLYPANKAAKKHPIEALRYDG